MRTSLLFAAFVSFAVGIAGTADALVIHGRIPAGTVQLGPDWPLDLELRTLLGRHRHVDGYYVDAPTWWDGYFSATYFYQGREPQLQALIDDLDRLVYPHVKIVVSEEEGMWTGNRVFCRKTALNYDWCLVLSQTDIRNAAKFPPVGDHVINTPVIVLRIHLGDRLDQTKLRIPARLVNAPNPGNGPVIVAPLPAEAPASALHAIARAARRDEP
jgi:hypothetical protein